jgi:hypothetical protein
MGGGPDRLANSTRYVDQHRVTVEFEPRVRSQLTGADLKLKFYL